MNMMHWIGLAFGLLAPALMGVASDVKPAREAVRISFSEDDFRIGPAHKTKEIALAPGDKLTVALGSNPSTGYSWGEQATNSNPAVLKQVKHQRMNPKQPMPGAGGSESWTFEALQPGAAILNFSYGRPWEGGEKGAWTVKVTAKVQ